MPRELGLNVKWGVFLKASCNLPIAGFAELVENKLHLNALIADSQAGIYLTASASGQLDDYIALGQECSQQLLAQGAASIVTKYAKH